MRTCVFIILFFSLSRAFGGPFLGPEFTFTSGEIIYAQNKMYQAQAALKLIEQLEDQIQRKCPSCKLWREMGVYEGSNVLKHVVVGHPLGFEIRYTYDRPALEFNLSPLTGEELIKHESVLEDLVFDSAKAVGLVPHVDYGGGHIHIDLATSIGENPLLFRNFIVDFMNHSDLYNAFGAGPMNSPTLLELSEKQRGEYRKVIREIDELLSQQPAVMSSDRSRYLVQHIARLIQERVYYETPSRKEPSWKYQALNLSRILDTTVPWNEKTLEIRVFRAQNNLKEFISTGEMISGRINYLSQMTRPIVDRSNSIPSSPKSTAERLQLYTEQSKVSVEEIKPIIYNKNVLKVFDLKQCKDLL